MATTLIGKELYVKNGVLTVEFFDAPDISSQNYLRGIGYHLGTVTKENVAELTGGANLFMEVTKDAQKYYLIYDATKVETRKVTVTTDTGKTSTLDKVVGFATSLFDFFGKIKQSTATTTTGTGATGTGGATDPTSPEVPQAGNATLDWLKANWLWFMPSVVLIPLLIYLAIKKWAKPRVRVPSNEPIV